MTATDEQGLMTEALARAHLLAWLRTTETPNIRINEAQNRKGDQQLQIDNLVYELVGTDQIRVLGIAESKYNQSTKDAKGAVRTQIRNRIAALNEAYANNKRIVINGLKSTAQDGSFALAESVNMQTAIKMAVFGPGEEGRIRSGQAIDDFLNRGILPARMPETETEFGNLIIQSKACL